MTETLKAITELKDDTLDEVQGGTPLDALLVINELNGGTGRQDSTETGHANDLSFELCDPVKRRTQAGANPMDLKRG